MKKCQDWLQKTHPDMYARIWSPGEARPAPPPCPLRDLPLTRGICLAGAEALEAATASLSIEAQNRAAKDAQKKAAKAEAAEQKHADKLANSIVTVKRIERNKRKFVTAVSGLEAFDLDLKKVRRARPSRLLCIHSFTHEPISR